jgi:hypothetical protein
MSLCALVRNDAIGAAWNGCASSDAEGGAGCEARFALLSKHLPSNGKVDRIILCRVGAITCPHRISIHRRSWKRDGVFIGDHFTRRNSSECARESDVFRRQRLNVGEDRTKRFVETNS